MSEKPTLTAELDEPNQLDEPDQLNEPNQINEPNDLIELSPTSCTLCDGTTPSSPYTLADDLASAKA